MRTWQAHIKIARTVPGNFQSMVELTFIVSMLRRPFL